jgi:hypothetical protein
LPAPAARPTIETTQGDCRDGLKRRFETSGNTPGRGILMFLYWTINQKKDWELPVSDDNMAPWRNFFANLPLTLKSPRSAAQNRPGVERQKSLGQANGMATEKWEIYLC